MKINIMAGQERKSGKGKSEIIFLTIGVPTRGKSIASRDAVEEFAGILRTFAREQLAHLSAVRRSARKKMHMHLSGLKYGKGYKLRCCQGQLMAA